MSRAYTIEDIAPGGNFGAFTTKLPAAAVSSMELTHALIGHSEERKALLDIMETYDPSPIKSGQAALNSILQKEVTCALERKLHIVFCVRETLREQGEGDFDQKQKEKIRSIIGDVVFTQFCGSGQTSNHDSEDWDNLIDLGHDEMGSRVIMNKRVFEVDIPLHIGHTLDNPCGGYSGGYKPSSTGITHWKCISEHHVPVVFGFLPASRIDGQYRLDWRALP